MKNMSTVRAVLLIKVGLHFFEVDKAFLSQEVILNNEKGCYYYGQRQRFAGS